MKGINLEAIKRMRKVRRFTLLEMALLLGFSSQTTYRKYENGESKFHADHLPLLCEKFNCDISELFFEESFADSAKTEIDLNSFVSAKLGELGIGVIERLREELKN